MVPACNNQFAVRTDEVSRPGLHELGERIIEGNMVVPTILFGAGYFVIDDQAPVARFICAKQRGA